MAFSKAHRFPPTDFHFSLICHALSHPARIAILRMLFSKQKCSVAELQQLIPLCPASVSQHLKIMRDMQILCCEEQFPTVIYWLNTNLPFTYVVLIDLLLRISTYFPEKHKEEIPQVARFSGPLRPAQ